MYSFFDSEFLYGILFTIGNSDISLFLLLIVTFIIVFAYKLSSFLRKTIFPNIYKKYRLDKPTQLTFNSIFHYSIVVIVFFVSLSTMGIDLSSLTVFAGLFGVGIGFGMQNVISNFISGIILLFERPIKVGDRVVINDVIGDVLKIKIRATIIKTLENEHMIIPNSFFLQEQVINRSYGDLRVRKSVDVGVSYKSDVRLVERLILEAADVVAEEMGIILKDPKPFVRFMAFGDSSLDFKLFIWIDRPENEFPAKSELHFKIIELFRKNNVEIPFPQRDVHFFKTDPK